ncbi:nucleoside deaminase [Amphibacillus sp. MSJ-3]|uniref:nucleoside deaminase n=1 Tax=Amphibacillus sp. MSJ-3 TaxID=2841505 RepID=UPI001C0F16F5|nr:nucleoside deaminase [Amphibacillus sp. MSJ-3]MBU5593838.1 nucleoside deaminase [Amphibacillus sp. MSJ-3]
MDLKKIDEQFTLKAISLAELSKKQGNEPFGAVLVKDNTIVFTNENQIHTMSDPTFHAEHGLIRRFCQENKISDLSEYTLYSSCEPCFMCSGAMVWSKLGRLVFSAYAKDLDKILGEKEEAPSSLVFQHSVWTPEVTGGVLREKGVQLLESYFSSKDK